MTVTLAHEFGILVRKAPLERLGVSRNRLFEVMEVDRCLDEDDDLFSFGPHFGQEASDEFLRRLKALGLSYPDDVFVFEEPIPTWCALSVSIGDGE